jgi:hypothetical protein
METKQEGHKGQYFYLITTKPVYWRTYFIINLLFLSQGTKLFVLFVAVVKCIPLLVVFSVLVYPHCGHRST